MPLEDTIPGFKPEPAACSQQAMLWSVVVLLILGVGGLVTAAGVLGAGVGASPLVGTLLVLAADCALLLAALLWAGIVLAAARACAPADGEPGRDEAPFTHVVSG